MKTVAKLGGVAGAGVAILLASSFSSSSAAWATPACVTGSVASYEAAGFSCSVGPLTFSNFSFTSTALENALVGLTSVAPFTTTYQGHNEYGFLLTYSAAAGTGPGTTDVAITYNVTDSTGLITDAYILLNGNVTPPATAEVNEMLTPNGVSFGLAAPGQIGVSFPGIASLGAFKDQENDSIPGGEALTSQLANAFSTNVPEPGTLALFGAALLGCAVGLRRRSVKA